MAPAANVSPTQGVERQHTQDEVSIFTKGSLFERKMSFNDICYSNNKVMTTSEYIYLSWSNSVLHRWIAMLNVLMFVCTVNRQSISSIVLQVGRLRA